MEMLRTDDQVPPVLAKIGGIEVLCPDLNCGFSYSGDVDEIITDFSVDSNNILTVEGTGLPTNSADIEIDFAYAECIEFTITPNAEGTEITCQLDHAPEAGWYYPEVDGPNGLIEIQDGVDKLLIPLVVTSIIPSENLNE
jgi:hypothetical protein